MEMKQLRQSWGSIIRSPRVIEALCHVIKRARELNSEEYFPVRLREIGISGSSLRTDNVRDVDVVAVYVYRANILPEWRLFKRLLSLGSRDLWYLLDELEGRRSVETLIRYRREELIRLGLKPKWIESWLRWVRVSDIKWGIDRGLPIVYFDENILISRYLKQGWRRPRLEIHTAYYDEEKDELIYQYGEVPFVTIWRAGVGIVKPSLATVRRFLEDEAQKLREQAEAIIEGRRDDLTESYREALWAYENVEAHNPDIRRIVEVIKELMKILIDELRILLEETPGADSLPSYNTRLRTKMKEVHLAGSILLYIMRNEPKILMTINASKAERDPFDTMLKLVCRSSIRREGFHKKDIKLLFERARELMRKNATKLPLSKSRPIMI